MSTPWNDEVPRGIDPDFEDVPEKGAPTEGPASRLAVVSLVSGIAGFFLPLVGPVTAIVTGHVARDEIRRSKGRLGGDSLARAGLALGYVWMAFTVAAAGFLWTSTRRHERMTETAIARVHAMTSPVHHIPGEPFGPVVVPPAPPAPPQQFLTIRPGVVAVAVDPFGSPGDEAECDEPECDELECDEPGFDPIDDLECPPVPPSPPTLR